MIMNEKENPTRKSYVELVQKYMGVSEGTPEHKKMIDEYNKIQSSYKMNYSMPWCACFVSYINILSGGNKVSKSFPNTISVSAMKVMFQNKKRLVKSDAFIPQQGDIVFYRNKSHVGIVTNVSSGSTPDITITSGNSSNMVKSKKMCYDDFVKEIEYIGLPRFQ